MPTKLRWLAFASAAWTGSLLVLSPAGSLVARAEPPASVPSEVTEPAVSPTPIAGPRAKGRAGAKTRRRHRIRTAPPPGRSSDAAAEAARSKTMPTDDAPPSGGIRSPE
jgi:hypothetical protein